jgi:hypothetical protein
MNVSSIQGTSSTSANSATLAAIEVSDTPSWPPADPRCRGRGADMRETATAWRATSRGDIWEALMRKAVAPTARNSSRRRKLGGPKVLTRRERSGAKSIALRPLRFGCGGRRARDIASIVIEARPKRVGIVGASSDSWKRVRRINEDFGSVVLPVRGDRVGSRDVASNRVRTPTGSFQTRPDDGFELSRFESSQPFTHRAARCRSRSA